jgi:hypothetical protein
VFVANVQVFERLGAKIIWADLMMRQRADAHADPVGDRDCLHTFMPGPVDWWTVGLYNELEAEYLALPGVAESLPWQPVVLDDSVL